MGQPTDLLRRWFDEVWNRGRADAIDEMLAADAVMTGLGEEEIVGPEGFRAFHASFCETFADIHVDVDRVVEDGDEMAAWCRVTATHRESGTPVEFTGMVMGSVRNGQLFSGRNSWDFLGLAVQLGAVDAATVAPLLGA